VAGGEFVEVKEIEILREALAAAHVALVQAVLANVFVAIGLLVVVLDNGHLVTLTKRVRGIGALGTGLDVLLHRLAVNVRAGGGVLLVIIPADDRIRSDEALCILRVTVAFGDTVLALLGTKHTETVRGLGRGCHLKFSLRTGVVHTAHTVACGGRHSDLVLLVLARLANSSTNAIGGRGRRGNLVLVRVVALPVHGRAGLANLEDVPNRNLQDSTFDLHDPALAVILPVVGVVEDDVVGDQRGLAEVSTGAIE
jgi:hypothetical protein